MKILIYADPSCLYDVFLPSIQVMRDHLLRFCGRALLASGKVEIPVWHYGGHVVWGMTARLVRDLVSTFD